MKSAKVSGFLLLRDSADESIASSNIDLSTGSWSVSDSVSDAEGRLNFRSVLGYHQTNKAGLGSFHIPDIPPKRSYEYRKLLSSLVAEAAADQQLAKAAQLAVQGKWM